MRTTSGESNRIDRVSRSWLASFVRPAHLDKKRSLPNGDRSDKNADGQDYEGQISALEEECGCHDDARPKDRRPD